MRYLIFITFIWTIITFLEQLLQTGLIVYYIHMLTFPIKFALSGALFCTVYNYIERTVPKYLLILFVSILFSETVLVLLNSRLQFFVVQSVGDFTNITNLIQAEKGVLFLYHLILTYFILLSAIILLFVFLSKKKDLVQYKEVTRTMAISTIFVIVINLSQLLLIETTIDLTYISLVIVVYALYYTIYTKDMVFNLHTSGRGEILSNMREMYIISNEQKRIVEVSSLLLSKYDLTKDYVNEPLQVLFDDLEEKVVFYSDIDVRNAEASYKDHLHIREKKFKLKGMNQFGYMILLYDETQVFELLRELNRLSNFDTMTGLNNRNYMETLLESIKDAKNIGVISLDLNGLKINNDYLGHERGDYLLKRLSTIMKIATKDTSKKELARIGGDEFLIITYDITLNELLTIKEAIINEGKAKSIQDEVSVSVGYSLRSKENNNIYTLIQQADNEMYQMKKQVSPRYKEEMIKYLERINKFIR